MWWALPQSGQQEGLCQRVKEAFVAFASFLLMKGVMSWMLEKSRPQPMPRSAKPSPAPPVAGSGEQPTPLLAIPVLELAETAQCKHLEENADFSL